jgi:hypothetical protein
MRLGPVKAQATLTVNSTFNSHIFSMTVSAEYVKPMLVCQTHRQYSMLGMKNRTAPNDRKELPMIDWHPEQRSGLGTPFSSFDPLWI